MIWVTMKETENKDDGFDISARYLEIVISFQTVASRNTT